MNTIVHQETTSDVLVISASKSLREQLAGLQEACFAGAADAVEAALDRTRVAVIDATEDWPAVEEAFGLAVERLGADAVIVYTEQMHEGLELTVRCQGSLLLLGPMDACQWDEVLGHLVRRMAAVPAWEAAWAETPAPRAKPRRPRRPAKSRAAGFCRPILARQAAYDLQETTNGMAGEVVGRAKCNPMRVC
jgi:hypothetical protein